MHDRRSQDPLDALQSVLAPKRRGHGMALPQRLRLMAVRLDAGLRETPQGFIPLAFHMTRVDETVRRRLLHFLISDVQREAMTSPTCPPRVLDLLDRARNIVADESPACDERRRALAKDILAQEMPRRRRRHIHCQGAITMDRRLLFLRTVLPAEEADAFTPVNLWRVIAYARRCHRHAARRAGGGDRRSRCDRATARHGHRGRLGRSKASAPTSFDHTASFGHSSSPSIRGFGCWLLASQPHPTNRTPKEQPA